MAQTTSLHTMVKPGDTQEMLLLFQLLQKVWWNEKELV